MSVELLYNVLRERAVAGEEGLVLTILHAGRVFGVTIDPSAMKDLLAIDIDAPEGEGIPLHNFIQRYLVPALHHLKQELK